MKTYIVTMPNGTTYEIKGDRLHLHQTGKYYYIYDEDEKIVAGVSVDNVASVHLKAE